MEILHGSCWLCGIMTAQTRLISLCQQVSLIKKSPFELATITFQSQQNVCGFDWEFRG